MLSRDLRRNTSQRGSMMPLSDAMSQLFRDAFTSPYGAGAMTTGLAINLYEKDDNYILQIPLPGAKLDQLDITTRENVVTLQGTIDFTAPDGARPLFLGAGGGQFREQIILPSDVDAENVQAQYQDGVLTLMLPKAAHARERKVRITQAQAQSGGNGQRQGRLQDQGQTGTQQQATSGSAQTTSSGAGQPASSGTRQQSS